MKRLKKGFVWLMATVLLLGALPVQAWGALEETGSNSVVISTSIPRGKIGKSMTVSFNIKNDTGADWKDVSVQIAESDNYYAASDEDFRSGGVFPFEVTSNTFKSRYIGTVGAGKSRGASVSAKVRSDLTEGYYAVRIDVRAGDSTVASEFVNIWVSKSTSSTDDEAEKNVTFVMGENQSTPYAVYPNVINYSINLRNSSTVDARDVTVSMGLSKDTAEFPFEINEGNYDRTFEKIEAGTTVQLGYSMAVRSDAYTGYYPIKYTITFRDTADGALKTEEKSFYVNVKNKDKEDTMGDFNANDRTKARIVVDSYETIPKDIIAGDGFELVLRMKNASASVPATNILFSLESEKAADSAVFSTESGSSAIVVNSLAAGEVTELRVQMLSKAGVDQRSYALTIKEKYDSPEFKNAEESVVIDIPVRQIARLNTGTIEIMPDTINVGSETNVMFPVNNTGKVILYNVMVAFEADSIQPTDTYLGNIEPGKTSNVDIMLSGIAPTADDGIVKINITYEDENGEVQPPVVKEMKLYVNEEIPMDFGDMAGNFDDIPMEEPSFFQKYKMIIFPAAAVLVVAVATIIIVKKKKKKRLAEEEGMDDEIS